MNRYFFYCIKLEATYFEFIVYRFKSVFKYQNRVVNAYDFYLCNLNDVFGMPVVDK